MDETEKHWVFSPGTVAKMDVSPGGSGARARPVSTTKFKLGNK
jgi:hypothetical protein